MSVEFFFDTNVLVYAISKAPEDQPKRAKALELVEAGDFAISTQVLQEFYVTTTRKSRINMAPAKALEWIEQLAMQPCVSVETSLAIRGIELSERYRISYWDGAIIAAAEAIGAATILSEDLDQQAYAGIRVVNPFMTA